MKLLAVTLMTFWAAIDPGVLLEEVVFITASFSLITLLEHFLSNRMYRLHSDYEAKLRLEQAHELHRVEHKWWLERHMVERASAEADRVAAMEDQLTMESAMREMDDD